MATEPITALKRRRRSLLGRRRLKKKKKRMKMLRTVISWRIFDVEDWYDISIFQCNSKTCTGYR
jgi:hypothetical protein